MCLIDVGVINLCPVYLRIRIGGSDCKNCAIDGLVLRHNHTERLSIEVWRFLVTPNDDSDTSLTSPWAGTLIGRLHCELQHKQNSQCWPTDGTLKGESHEQFMPQMIGQHCAAWQCVAKLYVRLDEWYV